MEAAGAAQALQTENEALRTRLDQVAQGLVRWQHPLLRRGGFQRDQTGHVLGWLRINGHGEALLEGVVRAYCFAENECVACEKTTGIGALCQSFRSTFNFECPATDVDET